MHEREDDDLERENRDHLELEAEEQQAAGLGAEEARLTARRAFGNVTYTKEEVRLMGPWTRWDIILQDIRYAWRGLCKSPGFAVTAVLTLALAIGASTAVFTAVDSVLLKPLAYRDSGNLVVAWERIRFLSSEPTGPNPRHVDVWLKRATAFSGLTLLRQPGMGLAIGAGHPRVTSTVVCLPNLFEILRVQPFIGRTFIPEDGVKGHDNVAMLTYSLWQNQFHGDPHVIGRTIRLADVPHQVIGVLPPDFRFPNGNALRSFSSKQAVSGASDPAIFIPAVIDFTQFGWNSDYGNWVALARLKPGFTVRQAAAQLNTIQAQIVQEMPANEGGHEPGALSASVQPMQEALVGESKTGLWLLMAAVMGLMLIACLNLANTQLGRAMARRRETAVRAALGAARWRLVWNALAENLILAAAGGAGGVLLAAAGLALFRRYSPVDLPRMGEIHLNLTVLCFSGLLALASSMLFGILPALRLLATDPQAALQQNNTRALGSRQSHRLRTWLIGFQVCGCTALLLITGLFSRSLLHLLQQDKGFDTSHVAVAEVRLAPQTYRKGESRTAFDDAVLANLRAVPGVRWGGLVSAMPLDGESWIDPLPRADRPDLQTPMINLRWVSPGYFEATGQRLVAGRFFEERDRNQNSIIISGGEAKALWGSENPIGGQVICRGHPRTVIGVVADSQNTSLKSAPVKMAYLPYPDFPPYVTFFVARGNVRPLGTAEALLGSMRQAIWKYAPDVTIARLKTLDAQVSDSLAPERFQTFVLLAFGGAALLLAMLGIYGVLSYSVATRKQEIGVRIALGATRARIYGLTLVEACAPVFGGLAAGLIASVLAGRVIRNLLYETQVIDAGVILMVAGLFLTAAAAAAFLPARRAAGVEPMEALRAE